MRPIAGPRILVSLAGLAALLAAALPAGAGGAPSPAVPITFSHGHLVDIQRLAGEPELKADSKGNLYVTGPIGVQYAHSFLWKSEDGGDSFDLLRAFPPMQRPMASAGSGDATTAIVPGPPGSTEDAVIWSDMVNLAGLANAATFDGGNTFPPEYWNLYASDPGADRQWLDGIRLPGTQTDRVYQVYNETPIGGLSVIYSDDYGRSWRVGQRNIDGFSSVGNVAADPVQGKVHIAYASGSSARVATAGLDAAGFTPVTAGTGNGTLANLFVSVAVDTAGNVYVAFSEANTPRATYLAVSQDGGQTFGPKIRVSSPEQRATIFPWVVAGDPGRAWVVWYGSEANAAPPSNRGPWHLYGAQTLDALASDPTIEVVRISEHPMHDNEVCLSGIGCTAGQGEDRNLLDDFTADVDPRGMLHVSFNDTNNQLSASLDPEAGGAFVVHARQESGPSLYEDVGEVVPTPPAPAASATVEGGSVLVTGTHSLPPGNWSADVAGDGRNPRHGPTGPGANDPALDIRQMWGERRADGGNSFHLVLGGPLAPLTGGGRTVQYLVFYWENGYVHFAAVEAVAGQLTAAYGGYPTGIPNQAGIPKFATYQLNPAVARPIEAELVEPDHIELRFSPTGGPPGNRLDYLTGFTHLLNGGPGTELLMDQIDGTPSATYVTGDPRLPAGRVEVSVDDETFADPVVAGLTDYPGPSFGAAIEGLEPGEHTIYVRQVANGFAGEALALAVTL